MDIKLWQINVTDCMIQGPAHDLAQWRSASGHRQN